LDIPPISAKSRIAGGVTDRCPSCERQLRREVERSPFALTTFNLTDGGGMPGPAFSCTAIHDNL
jgi:hypothetical protein